MGQHHVVAVLAVQPVLEDGVQAVGVNAHGVCAWGEADAGQLVVELLHGDQQASGGKGEAGLGHVLGLLKFHVVGRRRTAHVYGDGDIKGAGGPDTDDPGSGVDPILNQCFEPGGFGFTQACVVILDSPPQSELPQWGTVSQAPRGGSAMRWADVVAGHSRKGVSSMGGRPLSHRCVTYVSARRGSTGPSAHVNRLLPLRVLVAGCGRGRLGIGVGGTGHGVQPQQAPCLLLQVDEARTHRPSKEARAEVIVGGLGDLR